MKIIKSKILEKYEAAQTDPVNIRKQAEKYRRDLEKISQSDRGLLLRNAIIERKEEYEKIKAVEDPKSRTEKMAFWLMDAKENLILGDYTFTSLPGCNHTHLELR